MGFIRIYRGLAIKGAGTERFRGGRVRENSEGDGTRSGAGGKRLRMEDDMRWEVELETKELEKKSMMVLETVPKASMSWEVALEVGPETKESRGKGNMAPEVRNMRLWKPSSLSLKVCQSQLILELYCTKRQLQIFGNI